MAVDVRHEQVAAVARLLRDVLGGQHAGHAGLALDDDLLAPDSGELLRDHARQRVGAAAGREADHDAHRAVGPLLREHVREAQRGGRRAGGLDERSTLHVVSSLRVAQAAAFSDVRCGCEAKNSIAACTPLPASGTPLSLSPISQPDSAAISVRSLQSPRWPMRNMRPLTLPRPVPSDRSKRSWMSWRTRSASTPSGITT